MGSFSRATLLGGVAFRVSMDQYIRINAHLTVAKTILCALLLSSLTESICSKGLVEFPEMASGGHGECSSTQREAFEEQVSSGGGAHTLQQSGEVEDNSRSKMDSVMEQFFMGEC